MSVEIKVPVLPESVADATVVTWHKKAGDAVKRDEVLVDLETDKVVLEVPAIADGVLETIAMPEGSVVKSGEILGTLSASGAPAQAEAAKTEAAPAKTADASAAVTPSARRAAQELGVDAAKVQGSGVGGRVTREDVQQNRKAPVAASVSIDMPEGDRPIKRVPMSRMRARIAERLLEVKRNTALLTSFNEINMSAVIDARNRHKEKFEKKYGVRLGFMSFFTRAVVEALKHFPVVNASLEGNDIVYHGYYDIGMAVATDKGLVVPVVRNADRLSYAEIEKKIVEFSTRARNGQITLEDMMGGTFTITNGGVFGSLLSTPIINPPQSAILGLHKIQERPVAENGQVVIRPMMYVALSYDHCLIDGKDSVQFLMTLKQYLEDPACLMLDL